MPFTGSTFNLIAGHPRAAADPLPVSFFNNTMTDFATGFSSVVKKNGDTTMTGNLPMGGFKVTGSADGSALTDLVTLQQLQKSYATLLGSVSGTNTVTAAATPTITAYATGLSFILIPANTNTGAVTLNINSVGAVNLQKNSNTALAAGDLLAGVAYNVMYRSGGYFELMGEAPATRLLATSGTAGTNTITATASPAPTAYVSGALVVLIPANNNTGAVTLNLNSLGAQAVEKGSGTALAANDLVSGYTYLLRYNGTKFIVLNPTQSTLEVSTAGRLQYTNATTLTFVPFNGNQLYINGVNYTIPAAGITVTTGSTALSTLYYVYAYMSGSTMTLEASTTAPTSVDTTTGIRNKSADTTRTLVGIFRTNASNQFTANTTRSWFNRDPIRVSGAFSTNRTTTSTSMTEVNTETRADIVCWDDDLITSTIRGLSQNSASAFSVASVYADGSTEISSRGIGFGTGGASSTASGAYKGLSTGYHYLTLMGAVSSASTATYVTTAIYGGFGYDATITQG
jgi:hypothetical protein